MPKALLDMGVSQRNKTRSLHLSSSGRDLKKSVKTTDAGKMENGRTASSKQSHLNSGIS